MVEDNEGIFNGWSSSGRYDYVLETVEALDRGWVY